MTFGKSSLSNKNTASLYHSPLQLQLPSQWKAFLKLMLQQKHFIFGKRKTSCPLPPLFFKSLKQQSFLHYSSTLCKWYSEREIDARTQTQELKSNKFNYKMERSMPFTTYHNRFIITDSDDFRLRRFSCEIWNFFFASEIYNVFSCEIYDLFSGEVYDFYSCEIYDFFRSWKRISESRSQIAEELHGLTL